MNPTMYEAFLSYLRGEIDKEAMTEICLAADRDAKQLRGELADGDYWMKRADDAASMGMCPCCHCGDEGPHKDGCEWEAMESESDALRKLCDLTFCTYCGANFSAFDDDSAKRVSDHIATCPKHPMRIVEAERDAARAALREAASEANKARDLGFWWEECKCDKCSRWRKAAGIPEPKERGVAAGLSAMQAIPAAPEAVTEAADSGDCACVVCGCLGNGRCGHNPPQWALDSGRGCALDARGVCPCCAKPTQEPKP